MSYKVIFHPDVAEEFIRAVEWYEQRLEGLGERFTAHVDRHIKRISIHPEHYQLKKRNFREAKVHSFPYVVVYKFFPEEGYIAITDLFHTSKRPGKKYRR